MSKTLVWLAAVGAAGALLASGPARANTPVSSDQFSAGWQAHAKALINRGPSPGLSANDTWWVPGSLGRGHYVLINRTGDRAEVIDGYAFDITSAANREIKLMVPHGYGAVEALPAEDVPGLRDQQTRSRFEGH